MLKLRIARASGESSEHEVTPVIEFEFEEHAKTGFFKAFREHEKQSDVYYLAWLCLKNDGIGVKPFGKEFIKDLAKVDLLDADSPNG